MPKISLADNSGGTSPDEFTYNPVEIDCPQARISGSTKSVETVDGESITFYPYFDSRRGAMRWRGYPKDASTLGVAFQAQIDLLRTYIGTDTWMHFQDISGAYDQYESWIKVKIISINTTLRTGGSQIYDPVELIWENAEA